MRETARILYVLKYLQEQSDDNHPVSTNQILEYLENQGFKTNRHTVPSDIKVLSDFGYDVVKVKSAQNLYFIGDRHFQLPELELLVDAVLSSKFITPKKSATLINKLYELASVHQRNSFDKSVYVYDRIKPLNETIYFTTDKIQTAINGKKQITFNYFDYLPDKSKELKHNGFTYRFSPYALVWNEDKYYTLGFSEKHGKITTFRVDRMCKVKSTTKEAVPRPPDFNPAEFCKRVFEMYDGEKGTVELKCKNELMKVIIDKFGEDVQTEIINSEWFKATAEVCISPMFFGWLFQFTGRMILLSPACSLDEYRQMLINATKTEHS